MVILKNHVLWSALSRQHSQAIGGQTMACFQVTLRVAVRNALEAVEEQDGG